MNTLKEGEGDMHNHRNPKKTFLGSKVVPSDPILPERPVAMVIVGAGSLVGDLISLVRERNNFRLMGILDPDVNLRGQFIQEIPILGWLGDIPRHVTAAIIGNPAESNGFDRESVYRLLLQQSISLPVFSSLTSNCAFEVTLRRGTLLLSGCSVEQGASLGENCIVGPGATVSCNAVVPSNTVLLNNASFNLTSEVSSKVTPKCLKATLASNRETIQSVIHKINWANMEIVLVVSDKGALLGTVTDGDIRRGILAGIDMRQPVSTVMNHNPISVPLGTSRDEMLRIMRDHSIRHLPVLDSMGCPVSLERIETIVDDMTTGQGAVVMAGGLGMRMRPLTNNTPKPLLPVAGRPILDHILDNLRSANIEDVVITLNYLSDHIRNHVGDGRQNGLNVNYVSETQRLGTAGALSLLPKRPKSPFILINGDLVTDINFSRLLKFQRENNHTMVVCVNQNRISIPYGVVDIVDGQIQGIREKPVIEQFFNAGIYVLTPSCLDLIPENKYFDITDLIQELLARKESIGAFPIIEYWRDIGNPDDLLAVNRERTLNKLQRNFNNDDLTSVPLEILG